MPVRKRLLSPEFIIGYLVYCAVYVCRQNLSVVAPLLQRVSMLDTSQAGWLSSAFLVTYAAGRLVNGVVGDRVRPAVMISVGLAVAGVSNLLFALCPAFAARLPLWGLNGYAQSMIWGPLLGAVARRAPDAKRRLAGQLLVSSVATGSVLGILLASFFASRDALAAAFIAPGLIALALSAVAWRVFRADRPACVSTRGEEARTLCSREVLAMLGVAALHGVLKDNLPFWAPAFFLRTYDVNVQGMSFFALILPLVGLAGRLLYPMLYRACGERENRVSMLSFIACALALTPVALGRASAGVAAVCLGMVSLAVSLVNTAVLSMFPLRFAATGHVSSVSGFMDFGTYLGAAIGSAIYGGLIDRMGFTGMYGSWMLLAALGAAGALLIDRQARRTLE